MAIKISIIISAARGELRHKGFSPEQCSFRDVQDILDDMAKEGKQAGLWFWSASDLDINRLRREWDKWATS